MAVTNNIREIREQRGIYPVSYTHLEFLPTGLKFSDDTHLLFSSNKVKKSKEARISQYLQHRCV